MRAIRWRIIGGRRSWLRRWAGKRAARWWILFGLGALLGGALAGLHAGVRADKPSVPADRASAVESREGADSASAQETLNRDMAGTGSSREVAPSDRQDDAQPAPGPLDRMIVRVYLTKEKRIEKVPLELYIRGVVAGEMPIEFEEEALKAQAIAARTYIVRRLTLGDRSGITVDGADVTDTIDHQVYISLKQLAKQWPKEERKKNLDKLNRVVEETKGLVITYDGEPIEAAFFSTSNGYTENSEDYWQEELPYLRSVASPWDIHISPKYKETVTFELSEFCRLLGIRKREAASLRVLEWTDGHRIQSVAAGDRTWSGREVREKLGLPSTQFEWKIEGDKVEVTTYGYGHGVGMSQWGANGMAMEGSTAGQILRHYYSGTKIEQASKLVER